MDYIKTFINYCNVYFNGKEVRVSNVSTKQQKIVEFELTLKNVITIAENDFNVQIDTLTNMAYNAGYPDMVTLNREFINSMRERIRDFRDKQIQNSGLYD
jgi:hypothetical protein